MEHPNSAPRHRARDGELFHRRDVLAGVTLAATIPVLEPGPVHAAPISADRMSDVSVQLIVNGAPARLRVDTRVTLLDALREHLLLTGTKKGCDHGQCGACTVIVNGARINSCLSLAVMHEGHQVVTVEGLGSPGRLHPMQRAFLEHDGYQCGYCTPGQICSAVAVLDELRQGVPSHVQDDLMAGPALSDAEVRERMSGNICRCGAYSNIVAAIMDAGTEAA